MTERITPPREATIDPPADPDRIAAQTASIDDGDQAATAGDWSRALSFWEQQYISGDRDASAQRIRWFLREATNESSPASLLPRARSQARIWLMAGVGCGMIGTAMVLLGEGQTGRTQDLLAGLAWLLYITAAASAVAYAYLVGRKDETVTPPLRDDELRTANWIALALDSTNRTTYRN